MNFKASMSYLIMLLFLAFSGCKAVTTDQGDTLFGATWELDYITGPRIAFEGLFPDKKPQITFDKASGRVSGNSGCNGYTAGYVLKGPSLTFGMPGPATKMYCGEGEARFLEMIQKVDGYEIDQDGRLHLLSGDLPLMRFRNLNQIQ